MAYHDQYAGNQEYNPYANPQPHASYETPQAASDETYQDQDTAYHPTGEILPSIVWRDLRHLNFPLSKL